MRTGWHLDLCFLSAHWECVKLWCCIGLFAGTTCMHWLIQAGIKGMLRCFKFENWSFSCSLYSWKKARWSVSCCLFSEPSGMPAGVWARSVSASEIEVNWQALSYSPERVLGYEVYFTLLNGNRNLTHRYTHTTFQMFVITPVVPESLHLQPKLYSSLYQDDRKNISQYFQNCLSACLFVLLLVTG